MVAETTHSFIITEDNSGRKGESMYYKERIDRSGRMGSWKHKIPNKIKGMKSIFFSSLVEEIATPKWCWPTRLWAN